VTEGNTWPRLSAPLAGSLVALALVAYTSYLDAYDTEAFYRSVQEDEYLEWGTFWAFVLAAAVNVLGAVRQRRASGGLPWFLLGVSAFCVVVAMEEISWGQRVLGYRPPAYFLEHNFQQEFNLHNVISSDLRKLALKLVIGGYGIALPLLGLVPPVRRLLDRLSIVAPSAAWIPLFAAAYWIYEDYPWKFAGEVVELMLGLGFLFVALERSREFASAPALPRPGGQALAMVIAGTLSLGLGMAQASVSRFQRGASPEAIENARQELEALKRDFFANAENGLLPVRCSVHKRLYTYVERYEQRFLTRGAFAALTQQGLPDARAEFFIDPWNNAYWLRTKCSKDRRKQRVFLYSFGPNRRRDSGRWELAGDDIGILLRRSPPEAETNTSR